MLMHIAINKVSNIGNLLHSLKKMILSYVVMTGYIAYCVKSFVEKKKNM